MKDFVNFKAFEKHILTLISKEELHMGAMLETMAQYVEDEAKRKFGVYQESAGPFPGWAPLSPATIQDRERKGFEPDNPLYRTGELMHSIYHKVDIKTRMAVIGSDEDIMVYQELGTPYAAHPIPPRPVLGPAAFQAKDKIKKIAITSIELLFNNKNPIKKYLP